MYIPMCVTLNVHTNILKILYITCGGIMEVNNQEEIDLTEIYTIIKRSILVILALASASAILVFAYTKVFVAKQYTSSGTFIVNNRKTDTGGNITNDEINSAKGLTSVYSIIIKSDPVVDAVINNLSLDYTTGQLQSMLSVSAVDNTQVMKVSVKTKSAEEAAAIVNEILQIAPEFIVDKVEAGSVKIISDAKVHPKAVAPNASRSAVLIFAVVAMGSAGVIVLINLMDKSIKSEQDIEKHLGIPLLGIIPNTDSVRGHVK